MPKELSKLTEAEKLQMFDAIPLITILVAGADGKIDEDELEWAEKVTQIRAYDYSNKLSDYFQKVGERYSTRLKELLASLPDDTAERTQAVSDQLAALNPLLKKMDSFDARHYYKNYLTFARHVAESSGGVLGFGRINAKEAAVIELPMLDVIE